jgi:hypothetical protein
MQMNYVRSFSILLASLSLVSCGGGGGGGGGTISGGGGGSSTPAPSTVIKINTNDLSYRLPDAGDILIYDVTITAKEWYYTDLVGQNTISTTLQLEHFNPPSNVNATYQDMTDQLETDGAKVLKVVRTLGSGDSVDDTTVAYTLNRVRDVYDSDGAYLEARDDDGDGNSEYYFLDFLPPLEAGSSFSVEEYYQFEHGWQNGQPFWSGRRDWNVSNFTELNLPYDEIEAFPVTYLDERFRKAVFIQYYSEDQAERLQGTVYIHPKIGIVKAELTLELDESVVGIETAFSGDWYSEEAVWELKDVNFSTPTPQ